MNAIFLKTFNLRNYEEDPLSAGEILLFTKLESIDRRDQFAVNALYRAAPTILKLRGLKGGYDVRIFISLLFKDARGNPERCARGLRELADGIYLQAANIRYISLIVFTFL